MAPIGFKKKEVIPADRLCIRLKALRDTAGVSLEELAEKTRINRAYLVALEECKFAELKFSPVYQKNFIKKYVQTLGEDPRSYLSQFADEELVEKHAPLMISRTYRSNSFQLSDIPNTIRIGVLGLVVVGLLSYLGLHVHNILKSPYLAVLNPTDGYISEENNIVITGSSEPETKIMVNEVLIKNDEQGNFSESITLTPGINTLVVKAENKHGRATKETRHVIYKHTEVISRK